MDSLSEVYGWASITPTITVRHQETATNMNGAQDFGNYCNRSLFLNKKADSFEAMQYE